MKLIDYIRGQRHGKEANKLEQEAMNDPFLQDAIDGFDSVEGDHLSAIKQLERRLAPQPQRADNRMWIWAAAAVLVLLIGIPILFYQPDVNTEQLVSSQPDKELKDSVASSKPAMDSNLTAKQKQDEITAEKTKTTTSPPPVLAMTKKSEPKKQTEDASEQLDKIIVMETPPIMQKEDANQSIDTKNSMAADIPSQNGKTLSGKTAGAIATKSRSDENIKIRGLATLPKNNRAIAGRVVDEYGDPVIGASVHVKNSSQATVTDMDGYFSLNVPKDQKEVLVASYVGMETQEIPVKDQVGDVVMKDRTDELSEVVVTGYSKQRKKLFTGSSSTVKTDMPDFGEKEFIEYFKEHYDQTICPDVPVSAKVEFYVNKKGRISEIRIKETSCAAIEPEVRRLLKDSPAWSERNRNVELQITLE